MWRLKREETMLMKKSYVIPPGKGFIDQKFKTLG